MQPCEEAVARYELLTLLQPPREDWVSEREKRGQSRIEVVLKVSSKYYKISWGTSGVYMRLRGRQAGYIPMNYIINFFFHVPLV